MIALAGCHTSSCVRDDTTMGLCFSLMRLQSLYIMHAVDAQQEFVLCLDTQICFSRHVRGRVKNKMLLLVVSNEEGKKCAITARKCNRKKHDCACLCGFAACQSYNVENKKGKKLPSPSQERKCQSLHNTHSVRLEPRWCNRRKYRARTESL